MGVLVFFVTIEVAGGEGAAEGFRGGFFSSVKAIRSSRFRRGFLIGRSRCVSQLRYARPVARRELAARIRIPYFSHMRPNCVTGTTPQLPCRNRFSFAHVGKGEGGASYPQ